MNKSHSRREALSERLRKAREARGLTQEQAAPLLGVHRVTYAKWETGAHEPRGAARLYVESWIKKGR